MNYEELTDKELKKEYQRLKKKASQLHNKQWMVKILINALYGAVANKYFQYFIERMAEAITLGGQLSIMSAEKALNDFMNKTLKTQDIDYVSYIDTDSAYLNTDPLVSVVFGDEDISNDKLESFLDRVGSEKINPVLKKAFDELAETMGAYRNAMSMKREKIIKKILFLGKKHYILIALNSEGVHYDEPKMSVAGMESVKSSTPAVCREKMKMIYKVIMDEDEKKAQVFIADFKEVFRTLSPSEIAKNSGTPDISSAEASRP